MNCIVSNEHQEATQVIAKGLQVENGPLPLCSDLSQPFSFQVILSKTQSLFYIIMVILRNRKEGYPGYRHWLRICQSEDIV